MGCVSPVGRSDTGVMGAELTERLSDQGRAVNGGLKLKISCDACDACWVHSDANLTLAGMLCAGFLLLQMIWRRWYGQRTGATWPSFTSFTWLWLSNGAATCRICEHSSRCTREGAFARLAAELESGYLGQDWTACLCLWSVFGSLDNFANILFRWSLWKSAGRQRKDTVGGFGQQRHSRLPSRVRSTDRFMSPLPLKHHDSWLTMGVLWGHHWRFLKMQLRQPRPWSDYISTGCEQHSFCCRVPESCWRSGHQVGTLVRPFVEPELGFDIYSRTSAPSGAAAKRIWLEKCDSCACRYHDVASFRWWWWVLLFLCRTPQENKAAFNMLQSVVGIVQAGLAELSISKMALEEWSRSKARHFGRMVCNWLNACVKKQ